MFFSFTSMNIKSIIVKSLLTVITVYFTFLGIIYFDVYDDRLKKSNKIAESYSKQFPSRNIEIFQKDDLITIIFPTAVFKSSNLIDIQPFFC